jgi:hypothetical protein
MELKPQDVKRFFQELSRQWRHPTRLLLIGGAGALLMGGARPTMDVDFEVQFLSTEGSWELFEEAVRKVTEETGIGAQCAESIERWSELTLLDYRRHSRRVGRFGAIEVRVLEPEYWSIGKIGRYWDQDIQDMIAVFKRQKPNPVRLAQIWARAISRSPKSTQLALVRRQALHFFRTSGTEIWGKTLPLEKVNTLFSLPS